MSVSTVIVTPSVLLREGIISLLQNTRYKVVANAARPAQLTRPHNPKGQQTLAIVGIDLENGNLDEGAESIRLLRSLLPDSKVVLVAETGRGSIDAHRLFTLPIDGGIFDLGSRDALIKVLELAFQDQRVFVFAKSIAANFKKEDVEYADPPTGRLQIDPCSAGRSDPSLSLREAEILNSLAQGNSNKVIARLHNLSEATVKVHLKSILRKTKVQNRTQAAVWAIQRGYQKRSVENTTLVPDIRKAKHVNGLTAL